MSTALVSFCDFNETFYKNNISAHKGSFPLDTRRLSSPPLCVTVSRRNSASIIPATSTPISMQQKPTSGALLPVSSPEDVISMTITEHHKLDRSLSEPVSQSKLIQANSSRYKTELCRPFEENGTCKYGDKCQFAHGFQELRTLARHPKYKTELCRTFHTTGLCPYGPRCHFIHNNDESRRYMLNLQAGMNPSKTSRAGLSLSRPKTLSLGSYSMGSAGELSPPSSLSASPTSLNSFFTDDMLGNIPSAPYTAGPTLGSTSFPFSYDFTGLISPVKQQTSASTFGGSQPSLNPIVASNVNSLGDTLPENIMYSSNPLFSLHAPPSPVDSVSSELGGSPRGAICSSPLDVSRNLSRLPIFSKLSHLDTD
ncbi:mRNA decay activator protein ZFP36L2-A-like [Limulus polyphemus]|uniref:mRNA decay activator protein ZFP36L2-A-like n=1 Tax=Limulus polyphemus TaxID=6850 RepID=A0ABM1BTI7_LIMPO|nr:mRNA decay activator protein ZFP36L2-A-like [Limulus polyphemus]